MKELFLGECVKANVHERIHSVFHQYFLQNMTKNADRQELPKVRSNYAENQQINQLFEQIGTSSKMLRITVILCWYSASPIRFCCVSWHPIYIIHLCCSYVNSSLCLSSFSQALKLPIECFFYVPISHNILLCRPALPCWPLIVYCITPTHN